LAFPWAKLLKLLAPKTLLHGEGLVALGAASLVYQAEGFRWSLFFLLFFVPDLSMVGYLGGTKVGAAVYNAAHTYSVPALLGLIAFFGHRSSLLPLALIWVGHIGFDRLLGYGLKYPTAFKDTDLARI
jgi:hypothetical protein